MARWLFPLAMAILLAGCGEKESLRIGFIGGLSGRVADAGIAGRDGAQLAVDLRNAAGGVNGRKIELFSEDDHQDPEVARIGLERLIQHKVAGVVGPMTSAMAVAMVPRANEAGLVLIAPTVTTNVLTAQDDHFFRIVSATRNQANVGAEYHAGRKQMKRVAAILDSRNRAYTESWLSDYRKAFEALGGAVVETVEFASGDKLHFAELVAQLLKARPDGILVLANSVDTAMILQQVRKRDTRVHMVGSEWAATERLIELAGKAAEGFTAGQFVDRAGREPAYVSMRSAYVERFGTEPGFAGVTGFDAANVLLDALAKQSAGQTLKQVLLSGQSFSGVQSPIAFDAYGDVKRPTFITTVREGRFVLAD